MLPTIATARLLLRPLTLGDAAPLARLAGDRGVATMLTRVPHPYHLADALEFLAYLRLPSTFAVERVFAVERRGAFIGTVGLTSRSSFTADTCTLGYWFGRPYWGQGFASEAAGAVIRDYAVARLGMAEIASGAFEDNIASLRVQEKLGFARVGTRMIGSLARGGEVRHIDTRLVCGRAGAAAS